MALNVLTPIVSFLTAGAMTLWVVPEREEGAGFASSAGETEGPIAAASWAFGIWGVIYAGYAMFVMYQAMPSEWVPQRSDELIYVFMNLLPMINMIFNASWLPFAIETSQWSLILSTVVIWVMLITGLAIMIIADQTEVWWPEVFVVRIPWSIYTGWLIAANLLSTSSMLKSWGMRDP